MSNTFLTPSTIQANNFLKRWDCKVLQRLNEKENLKPINITEIQNCNLPFILYIEYVSRLIYNHRKNFLAKQHEA